MMYAMMQKNIRLAEFLINKGADMRIISPDGGGVFHYLLSFDEDVIKICKMLLENKEIVQYSLNSIDKDGFTPFLRHLEFFAENLANLKSKISSEQREIMEAELVALKQNEADTVMANSITSQTSQNSFGGPIGLLQNQGLQSAASPGVNTQGSLLFGNNPSLLSNTPSLFGNTSSLFGNPLPTSNTQPQLSFNSTTFGTTPSFTGNTSLLFGNTQATPLFANTQPQGIHSYLASNMSLQIDYAELGRRINQITQETIEKFIEFLQLMVEKGSDCYAFVEKISKYRENPNLIYTEEANIAPSRDHYGNILPQALFIIDIDGTKRYKEYGNKGLQNAFHLVSRASNIEIIDFLLSLQIDVNQRDFNGDTPLMLFVQSNFHQGIERLLEAKADPNIYNVVGDTPIFQAIESQNI